MEKACKGVFDSRETVRLEVQVDYGWFARETKLFGGKDEVTLALGGTSAACSRCDKCTWQVLMTNGIDLRKLRMVQDADLVCFSM